MNKNQKGITLIALVITIIVMLILVIVSIRIAITGGLFNKAGEAARETENAKEHEQQLAEGKVTIEGKEYATLDDYFSGNHVSVNWEQLLATTTEPHPEQTESTDIGIGTDGELVNLDNWRYKQTTIDGRSGFALDRVTSSGTNIYIHPLPSYKGEFVDGKIEGTVPAYIKIERDTFLPVISMVGTFQGCTSLTTAPTIPNTVISMDRTFLECTSLTTAPEIPNSVTDMYSTFSGCTSLTTAPTIPNSVTNMIGTFSGCTSLTTAPTIPNSVTHMSSTFSGCTSLTTAPTIPSSVTSISEIFKDCTNLQGTLTINATIEGTDTEDEKGGICNCLYGATTADNISLTVTGSAPAETLQAIVAQANNEKITYVEPPVINPQPDTLK